MTSDADDRLKQPHQDVGRPYGDDPLLSLGKAALPYRDALIWAAEHLNRAARTGASASGRAAQVWLRLRDPQPGDLVVESGTHWRGDVQDRMKGLGRLIIKRREWRHTDQQWAQLDTGGAQRPTDLAWYVQYGPRDVCRWTDCTFWVVPIDDSAEPLKW